MSDKEIEEAIKLEIEQKNFIRAAHLALSLGLGEDKLKELRSHA